MIKNYVILNPKVLYLSNNTTVKNEFPLILFYNLLKSHQFNKN